MNIFLRLTLSNPSKSEACLLLQKSLIFEDNPRLFFKNRRYQNPKGFDLIKPLVF
jgi:hypothetical protein